MPALIPESFRQDLNQNGPSFPLPAEQRARQGQAAILFPAILPSARHPDRFAAHRKEVARRNRSQVGISCDLLRPRASPLREISFGQGLQTPESATLTKLRPVGLHGPRGRARALSTLTSHSLRQGMHVWLTGARWAPLYERSAGPSRPSCSP